MCYALWDFVFESFKQTAFEKFKTENHPGKTQDGGTTTTTS
jgi:hypothetical protein